MSIDPAAVEMLGDALVFEYLKSRGLARTAEVYALETERKYPNLSESQSLATQMWVGFRHKLEMSDKKVRNSGKKRSAEEASAGGSSSSASPPSSLATASSTFEYILAKTIDTLNGNQNGFATSDSAAPSTEGAEVESGSRPSTQVSLALSSKKKKKKKQGGARTIKKYQSPKYERKPDVNHNVQFHSLGKPKIRRPVPAQLDADGEDFAVQKSREHWMPMELRLKMLKRDMMLAQHKQKDVNDWQMRKEKYSYKTDEHSRRKNLKELTKRGPIAKSTCALCEHGFLDLPFGVSYKAIMDLRRTWGVEVIPSSKYYKFSLIPHCYETVHVCVFCSQFFGLEFFDADRQKAVGV